MTNKTVKLFHGTTGESYESILKNGFDSNMNESIWTCSESDYIYFYNPQNFINEGECEDMEEAENRAIDSAFQNGQIAGGIHKSQSSYTYVLCVEVKLEDIQPDDSCDNMPLACKVSSDKLTSESIVKVYRSEFAYNMSLAYISGLKDMDFINLDNFSQFELNMMDKINDSNLYMNEDGIEWEEV